ncbi:MAG: hypothetical protein DRP01_04765 [Archaeoglobales archaeon]|nr:MAG: hypothetical protein DRP01_04765 [Archaeoglobales archaeon]
MAKMEELLKQVREHYNVVELTSRGYTAGGKIAEFDMYYLENDTIRYKRLHIFTDKEGNAYWYGENPIPPERRVTFTQEINEKIRDILSRETSVKYIRLDDVNERAERAIATAMIEKEGKVEEKRVLLYRDEEGKIAYAIL